MIVYKCINCERVWGLDMKEPIQYGELPEWVSISGGVCLDCLNKYFEHNKWKNGIR